jgi:hypothetical protein
MERILEVSTEEIKIDPSNPDALVSIQEEK